MGRWVGAVGSCALVVMLVAAGCLDWEPDGPVPEAPAPYQAPLDTAWDWVELAPLPRPVAAAACVVHQGGIFVIGGLDRFGIPRHDVHRYDLEGDQWQRESSLPLRSQVHGATAVVVDGRLQVVGGYGGHGTSTVRDTVLERNDKFGFFDEAPHRLPSPLAQATAVERDGQVLLAGGSHDGRTATGSVFAWQGRPDGWLLLTELQTPRSQAAFASTPEGLLVAAGGSARVTEGPLGSVQVQDLEGTQVLDWPTVPTPRDRTAAAGFEGLLFLLGGADAEGDPSAAAEFLQLATGDWFRIDEAPGPRSDACAVGSRLGVHLIGGTDEDGQARSDHWLLQPLRDG